MFFGTIESVKSSFMILIKIEFQTRFKQVKFEYYFWTYIEQMSIFKLWLIISPIPFITSQNICHNMLTYVLFQS